MLFAKTLLLLSLGISIAVPQKLGTINTSPSTPTTQAAVLGTTRTPRPAATPRPTRTPKPTTIPTSTPTATPVITPTPAPVISSYKQQVFDALNNYRAKKGVARLSLDQKLADFAQSRSDHLLTIGSLDGHVVFTDFIKNQNGFAALGFNGLGENQSWASNLPSATALIEGQYAADKPHDDNQLNPQWGWVGIGISGNYNDIVFGGSKR
jgi:uncharacterized protein YkwD